MRSCRLVLLVAIVGCGRTTPDTSSDCEPSPFYADADGDGFGSDADVQEACEAPAGYAEIGGDCDDSSEFAYPGAPDDCCTLDFNCDGVPGVDADGDGAASEDSHGPDCDDSDPSVQEKRRWAPDADGDGYGDETVDEVHSCHSPGDGYAPAVGDCDETRADVNPGMDEVCGDGVDGNCDGANTPCGVGGELEDAPAEVGLSWTGNEATRLFAVGDVDGDGTPDLALGWTRGYAFATARASATDTELAPWGGIAYPDEPAITALAPAGDFDGDGVDDLVLATDPSSGDGRVWLLAGSLATAMVLGDDLPHVLVPGAGSSDLGLAGLHATSDLTGDGAADLLVAEADQDVIWLFSQPWEGRTAGDATAQILGDVDDLLVCDLDGDGVADLTDSEGWTLQGPFSGTVSVADDPSAAWSYLAGHMKCAGDLDGDGGDDVIAVARTAEGLGIQALPGSALIAGGSLAGQALGTVLGANEDEEPVATGPVADLDGDGFADPTYEARYTASFVVWGPLEGTRTTDDPGAAQLQQPWPDSPVVAEAAVDFTGDGVSELVTRVRGGPLTTDSDYYVYVLSFADAW